MKLLSWIIVLGALGVGVYGAGAFDFYINKKWLIITLAIHAIPAISLMLPVRFLRVYGLWFGVFLITQYLLSLTLLGDARHYRTLLPNINRTINVVGDAMPGIQGVQRITTDAMGFRVQPPVDYEHKRGFRIFAIGASTIAQIFLDDRSTWTYLLQEQLAAETGRPVEVINTGLSGTRALHHLVMFRRILDYAPDCAMFLVGVNEWNKHIKEHFGSDQYRGEETTDRHFKQTLLGRALRAAKSYVYHTLPDLNGSVQTGDRSVQTEDGSYYSEQNDSLARPDRRTLAFDDVAPDYRAQIEEIGATCRASGVPCVFLTQPHGYSAGTNPEYRRYFWMTPLNEDYTLDLTSMGGIADLYNQYLIRFARKQGHDLIDLAAAMPAGTKSFYDDVHFNTEGARRVAIVLADELIAGACGFAE